MTLPFLPLRSVLFAGVFVFLILGGWYGQAHAQSAPYPYQTDPYRSRAYSTSYDLLGNYVEQGAYTYISGCTNYYDRGCYQQGQTRETGYPYTRTGDTYYGYRDTSSSYGYSYGRSDTRYNRSVDRRPSYTHTYYDQGYGEYRSIYRY